MELLEAILGPRIAGGRRGNKGEEGSQVVRQETSAGDVYKFNNWASYWHDGA